MAETIITQMVRSGATDRKLKAYAYLQASFATKPRHGQQVEDLFDCLVPFLVEGIAQQAGNQLSLNDLQSFLSERFDFQIPVYALEQILPRAQNLGALDWNPAIHVYTCTDVRDKNRPLEEPLDQELDQDFGSIEALLSDFAGEIGWKDPLHSESWTDALIHFLKSGVEIEVGDPKPVSGALVSDSAELEHYIVARFVQRCSQTDQQTFESITRIYTGVLIEDFIKSIQTTGVQEDYSKLTVYYDTSVLLRLLGTSGKDLQTATTELHRSIQDIGSSTAYFEHTEIEVVNILGTLLSNYDTGRELFGETAEALLDGEIIIEKIRDLDATFVERLAQQNIFKTKYAYENTQTDNYYQIDEDAFAKFLSNEATKKHKPYSPQNLYNDSKTLALIMRLRHGTRDRDVVKCKHVFVSSNRLLVRAARGYIATVEDFGWRSAPPLLTVGQISMLAWLVGAQELEQEKVSRGLLANCYGAVHPDPEWTPEFLRALDEFKEGQADLEIAESAVFLNAARRIAQDQSLSNTAILRKLTTVEIFAKAVKVATQQRADLEAEAQTREMVLREEAKQEGAKAVEHRFAGARHKRAQRWAAVTIDIGKVGLLVLFVGSLTLKSGIFGADRSILGLVAQLFVFILTIFSAMDVLRIAWAREWFNKLREYFTKRYEEILKLD